MEQDIIKKLIDDNELNPISKIAIFILKISENKENRIINNLRLQKLTYFFIGIYYSKTQKFLVEKENFKFLKWRLGPVNDQMYYDLKNLYDWNGYSQIKTSDYEKFLERKYSFSKESFDFFVKDIDIEIAKNVIQELNRYNTFSLVEKSHRENSPWFKADDSGLINSDEFYSYFDKSIYRGIESI